MAQMIPPLGPNFSESLISEPDIYWRLKRLPDSFTVIHSIPLISAAIRELDSKYPITSELDFLILHPELGILALEVKGGSVQIRKGQFGYVKRERGKEIFDAINPIGQVRKGTHGLAGWLGGSVDRKDLRFRIGYAIIFPNVEMPLDQLPPGLIDQSVQPGQSIVIDRPILLKNFLLRIQDIMGFWNSHHPSNVPTQQQIDRIISLCCPDHNYNLSWTTRICDDNTTWLKLTTEQSGVLSLLMKEARCVVEGRPGTGKTLLLIALARYLASEQKKVLVLVFNTALANYLREQLKSVEVNIIHYHGLCSDAESELRPIRGQRRPTHDSDWYQYEGPQALQNAIEWDLMPQYDALLVDEAQVFNSDRWNSLLLWFIGKRITAFCDEVQVFTFEHRTTADELTQLLGVQKPYLLTRNMRSPRSVFDRLQYVFPTSYLLSSARPEESDTLYEVATSNPFNALQEILSAIQSEGIHNGDVTLLYGMNIPSDNGPIKFNKVVGKVERITRFRGLESPIVIVWAVERLSEPDLFCALSRATTRCIIIYDIDRVSAGYLGKFGQAYIESPSTPRGIYEAMQSPWKYFVEFVVPRLRIDVEIVVEKSACVVWCSTWSAWIVVSSGEDIAAALWIRHLCISGQQSIYAWNIKKPTELQFFTGGHSVQYKDYVKAELVSLQYCNHCLRYTRRKYILHVSLEERYQCIEHNRDTAQFILDELYPLIESDKHKIKAWDEFTINHLQYSNAEKREKMKHMSVFLLILLMTQKLIEEQKRTLAHHIEADLAFGAAQLLVGHDLIVSEPSTILEATERSQTYMSWCPVLQESIDPDLWRNYVARAFGRWIGPYNWAKKLRPGVYQRAAEPTLISRLEKEGVGENNGDIAR